jgi:tetratricopeptide (TPR) repeat protein
VTSLFVGHADKSNYLLADILLGIGNAQKGRHENMQAIECYSQALDVMKSLQPETGHHRQISEASKSAVASILVNRALVYMQDGDMKTAERDLRRASQCTSR